MQVLELGFLIAVAALLVAQTTWVSPRRVGWVFGAGCLLAVLHAALEVVRWQIVPAYLLFALLTGLMLKQSRAHPAARLAGLVVGAAAIGASAWLAYQLPVRSLPAPGGPHLVGTLAYSVVDEAREEERSPDPDDRRELFVEVWYPAAASDGPLPPPRTLWRELYAGSLDRVSFLMGYLKGVDTHSHPGLPIAAGGPYPLVLFNHGLQMFTAQNTLLMEHLASHGYVVVSVGHPYDSIRVNLARAGTVLPPFIRSLDEFRAAMAWIEESSRPVREALVSIRQVERRDERAAIMRRATAGSELNATVSLWVEDTRFVLDRLEAGAPEASTLRNALDFSRVGVVGMSLGGATAAELCKTDERCGAGVNVDGLQYGVRRDEPLRVPFLMLYSDDGAGTNDLLALSAANDYYECQLVDSRHSDLTDLAVVWPILRTVGQAGPISGERAIAVVNAVVRGFLDRYLRDEPSRFPPEGAPELETRSFPARVMLGEAAAGS